MPAGCIAVVDAMGVQDAGIFGDILCPRMAKRGITALVSDGVVRDVQGVLGTNLPVWCGGAAAPASVTGLTFVAWQQPIACGGVAVFPGDVIVCDDDGAVLVPAGLLEHVLHEAPEQERLEGWIMDEVNNGAALTRSLPAERGEQGPLPSGHGTEGLITASFYVPWSTFKQSAVGESISCLTATHLECRFRVRPRQALGPEKIRQGGTPHPSLAALGRCAPSVRDPSVS